MDEAVAVYSFATTVKARGISMKNLKAFTVIMIILPVLFICSCDGTYTSDAISFDKKLRGTWVSNEPGLYSGSLKIDSYMITIDGYGEDWTSLVGDDSRRPFRDFPKRVPLPGYSEEGLIFIQYGDTAQDGIPYVYTYLGTYQRQYKLLEFSFGGRKEILQSMADF
jgi:hypothetical protein